MEPFSHEARVSIVYAREAAKSFGSSYIGPEHLLMGLAANEGSEVSGLLQKYGITSELLHNEIAKNLGDSSAYQSMMFTQAAKDVIQEAFKCSRRYERSSVGCEALLWAILKVAENCSRSSESEVICRILGSLDRQSLESLKEDLKSLIADSDEDSKDKRSSGAAAAGKKATMRTPVLDNYCRDLTKLAQEGKLDPLVGRHNELERVIMVLSRRNKCNPVLIGDPGVGKTAIVEGLAQRIVSGEVPDKLKSMRVCSLSLSSVVAGTRYRGDFEDRLNKILKELTDTKSKVILFIDEIHSLVGAGDSDGGMDASSILKPALARGEFQCIGATTVGEYTKYIEKDPALERRFQTVDIKEPSEQETCNIIFGLRDRYESFHNVDISEEAVREAVRLSNRYIPDRLLPDKAIDVIDEACSRVSLARANKPQELTSKAEELHDLMRRRDEALSEQDYELADDLRLKEESVRAVLNRLENDWQERLGRASVVKSKRPVVQVDNVAYVVSLMSGVPLNSVTQNEAARLGSIEKILHERVVGQDEPIKVVSRAIKRARAGLKDPNKPIGSFLFLGPTGVGKTELARTLAQFLFDDENALIRLDMSEYSEKFTVSRLYGAAPGYVGYDEGGELTDAVRRKPYSVVLFDEIEKAHPDIFNVLLQIMDEGRLTDSKRHVVDFKNVVVILTSNIGFANPDPSVNMGLRGNRDDGSPQVRFERMRKRVLDETKQVFKPEFLNRLDASVVFHSLEHEDLMKIVDIMLDKVRKELSVNHRDFEVTQDVKRALVASCREPQYGARPLRRAIQQMLEDPLADKVIEGEFPEGSRMLIDLSEESRIELTTREAEGMISSVGKNGDNGEEDNFRFVFKLAEE
ncbi:MAG: ATP-dependent Clp protease ATP-binding subunit [Candidatus Bruticola sp.]